MTNEELAKAAESFATEKTFYEYGGWGQTMSRAELDRLASLYPKNKPVDYEHVGQWGFDCICFIKGLMAGVTPMRHVDSYKEMAANPIGDCTNKEFLAMLTESFTTTTGDKVPRGYGLATESHAALSLGDGKWIDANRTGSQDGVRVHYGIPANYKAGKIPGITYDKPESDDVQDFLQFLYKLWKENK